MEVAPRAEQEGRDRERRPSAKGSGGRGRLEARIAFVARPLHTTHVAFLGHPHREEKDRLVRGSSVGPIAEAHHTR